MVQRHDTVAELTIYHFILYSFLTTLFVNLLYLVTGFAALVSIQYLGFHYNVIIIIIVILTAVLNSQGRKIMLCKDKIRKQDGMVFTFPPPSQNYQEVE